MNQILATLAEIAAHPLAYARTWKETHGRPVIGSFPMHFPGELTHASGGLPTIIQEADEPVTVGLGSVFSFYCGYNRSIVDQAVRGEFAFMDAIMFGDHCVQLLGSADIIRMETKTRVLYNELISSMSSPWAFSESRDAFRQLRAALEETVGYAVDDEAIRASIRVFNKDRALMRRLYDMRRAGETALTARQFQVIVKSSMVMDRAEHTALLEALLADIERHPTRPKPGVPVYLSGHLCQPPHPSILDAIEECGAVVVDDDLFHGYRYIASDVDDSGDPLDALANWYLSRNKRVPCPTRVDRTADWDEFLLRSVAASGAGGLIILLAKFCEPHMYFYPEIKEAFERAGIPLLLVETEHEGVPLEAVRTRVETFLEIVKRRESVEVA